MKEKKTRAKKSLHEQLNDLIKSYNKYGDPNGDKLPKIESLREEIKLRSN